MYKALVSLVLVGTLSMACEGSQFAADSKTNLVGSGDAQGDSTNGKGDDPANRTISEETGDKGSDNGEGCTKINGRKDIHVNGSQHNVVITDEEAVNIKVTGNLNEVAITVKGNADRSLASLCLFVAGNQNKVKVQVEGEVTSMAIKARGNQASVDINVIEGARLGEVKVDARGNSPSVAVSGAGTYPK